jgi:hypothetical protein
MKGEDGMHRLLACLALAGAAPAAVVQGVVLENISGRPVSRAIVRLYPVPRADSGAVQPATLRSDRSGHFVFSTVQAGVYLLTAVSEGFFPVAYGQRLPVGRGVPLQIAAETEMFAELRLGHKGALTGRVLDENGVGKSGVSVVAYRAWLPLRSAGSAKSDDRGVFRVAGLEPGKYWVRTAPYILDDGSGWLPTFSPYGREVREARTYQVTVDADTPDADVSPEPGTLFRLSGLVQCDSGGPAVVTLSAETGRRSTQVQCNTSYRFEGLAPAYYEIFAHRQDGTAAGFNELFLDRDNDSGNVLLLPVPVVDIDVLRNGGSHPGLASSIRLSGRRQDLAETETDVDITVPRAFLYPGHWELRVQAPRGQYVENIQGMRGPGRRPPNMPAVSDRFEIFVQQRYYSRIRISLSDQAGQISGKVVSEGKPVAGVPVFLWPTEDLPRRSLGGGLQILTNTGGEFRFDSLPPGDYRMLASFDVTEVDDEFMQMSNAVIVHAAGSQMAKIELPLWTAP